MGLSFWPQATSHGSLLGAGSVQGISVLERKGVAPAPKDVPRSQAGHGKPVTLGSEEPRLLCVGPSRRNGNLLFYLLLALAYSIGGEVWGGMLLGAVGAAFAG